MLLSDITRIPKKFKYLRRILTLFDSWVKKKKISKLSACLNFTFSMIDKIVLGTNYLQFKQTIDAIEKSNGKLAIPKHLKNINQNYLNPKIGKICKK